MADVSDCCWSSEDTSPAEVEDQLRRLIVRRHGANALYVPGRVLNMVCIADGDASEEIEQRLRNVGRYHASRTVLCKVTAGRRELAASASISAQDEPRDGAHSVLRETIVIEIGSEHLAHIETIVDPLVVTDLATVVWSPHGHPEAVEALLGLAQVVLVDTVGEESAGDALRRAAGFSEQVYVVDLAWLRSMPWRERIADSFDPPARRAQLHTITGVSVRHHADSTASALLICGWLASRLGWEASPLAARDGALRGRLRRSGGEVSVALEPVEQAARGLGGITVALADGSSLALDRGDGGLQAVLSDANGKRQQWTIVGASRGESGILGEGIRQALLRDPSYRPALQAAEAML